MPKSKANKSKKNRDFLMLKDKYVKDNYLKWLDVAVKHFTKTTDITQAETYFLLFTYDYEFFTSAKIAEQYGRSVSKTYNRLVLPLKRKGYLQAYYEHGRASAEIEQSLGITHKSARLSLSHSGRHAVQRFYRMVDGREEVSYHDLTPNQGSQEDY